MKNLLVPLMLVSLLLVAAYVGYHLFAIAPVQRTGKWLVVSGFVFALLCEVFIYFTRSVHALRPTGEGISLEVFAYHVGNTWLIALMYLFLVFLALDAARLLGILPRSFLHNSACGSACVVVVVTAILLGGYVCYNNKKRVEITVSTSKPIAKPAKIVMMSDLHFGYHIRRQEVAGWVDIINAEKPDFVLVGGDVVDISLRPVLHDGTSEELRRIKAPVYSVPGNHDYIVGIDADLRFQREAGFTVLRDSTVQDPATGIVVCGRDDRRNRRRLPVDSIVAPGAVAGSYSILVDHQPRRLEDAQKAGFDFQFSGHTHNGQVFPMSVFINALYQLSYGFSSIGSTNYYVSSGMGIWGAKYRVGTRSEYVVLNVVPE